VFPPIIRGLEDGLGRHGYSALLANTDGNALREVEIAEIMRARGVDGLALASIKYRDKLIKKAGLDTLPLVTVGRHTDDPKVSHVVHDEDGGFRRVLDHLISFGHQHVAYIAGPQDISTGRNRYRAVERHRKQMGLPAERQLVVFARAFNEHEGERCTDELLARSRDFSALVCANDRLAVGAIAALRRHGMNCPQDISVTGFNDMSMVDRLMPPLTTIRIQQYRAGCEAAEILIEAMQRPAGERKARHVVLPVELIVRESTKPISR
jgi:LacI family transcriptional regulator